MKLLEFLDVCESPVNITLRLASVKPDVLREMDVDVLEMEIESIHVGSHALDVCLK